MNNLTTRIKNNMVLGSGKSMATATKAAKTSSLMLATVLAVMPNMVSAKGGGTSKAMDKIMGSFSELLSQFWSAIYPLVNAVAFVAIAWNVLGAIFAKIENNPQKSAMKVENIKGIFIGWGFFAILGYFWEDIKNLAKGNNVQKDTPWKP